MNQDQPSQNLINLEMTIKLQMRDYRYSLRTKHAWVIAVAVAAIQLLVWFLKHH